MKGGLSRCEFLLATGATLGATAGQTDTMWADVTQMPPAADIPVAASSEMAALRRDILDSPVRVANLTPDMQNEILARAEHM